nr:MAG TPA: hypothetical protein [Caudoviricetes sp.]
MGNLERPARRCIPLVLRSRVCLVHRKENPSRTLRKEEVNGAGMVHSGAETHSRKLGLRRSGSL